MIQKNFLLIQRVVSLIEFLTKYLNFILIVSLNSLNFIDACLLIERLIDHTRFYLCQHFLALVSIYVSHELTF